MTILNLDIVKVPKDGPSSIIDALKCLNAKQLTSKKPLQ